VGARSPTWGASGQATTRIGGIIAGRIATCIPAPAESRTPVHPRPTTVSPGSGPRPTMTLRSPGRRNSGTQTLPSPRPTGNLRHDRPDGDGVSSRPAREEHPWNDAAMKITNEILEAYLNCKTKGHLKLAGEAGIQSEYEVMTTAACQASREAALARLVARFGEGDACRGVPATAATLKKGARLLVDATLEADGMSIRLDAVKRADGASKLGEHHYLPVLHNHGDKVGRARKLLLAMLGLVLARVQGVQAAVGLIARGPDGGLGKVCLNA